MQYYSTGCFVFRRPTGSMIVGTSSPVLVVSCHVTPSAAAQYAAFLNSLEA